jgi:YbbR domain-containing protein
MKIKNIIFNNFNLKILAFLVALLTWILITGKERTYLEETIDVNVEYFNVSNNIDVKNINPEKVRVKVKGISTEMKKIDLKDFKLKIDLKGTNQGMKLNKFTRDYLEYPVNVDVVSVYPQWIEITIEEFFIREVPVKVKYTGIFKNGIKLIKRSVKPEKVKIYGYKSQIKDIDMVYTAESIDLSKIDKTITFRLSLEKREEILKFKDSEEVEVTIAVKNRNVKSRGK